MSGFQLPPNFVEDPEQLLRRRRRQVSPQRFISETEPLVEGSPAPVVEAVMAQKTLQETHGFLTFSYVTVYGIYVTN